MTTIFRRFCRHRWETRSFQHTAHGYIAVNVCRKCGKTNPFFSWDGKFWGGDA